MKLTFKKMDELYEFILKEDDTILRTEFEEFMIDALKNCPQISRELTEKDLAKIAGGKSNFNKKLISTALSALTILPTATPLAGAAEPANGSSAESSVTSKKEVDKKEESSILSRLLKLATIPSALCLAALGYCKLRNTEEKHDEEQKHESEPETTPESTQELELLHVLQDILSKSTSLTQLDLQPKPAPKPEPQLELQLQPEPQPKSTAGAESSTLDPFLQLDLSVFENCSNIEHSLDYPFHIYHKFLCEIYISCLRDEAMQSSLPKFNTTFLENLKTEILKKYPNKFGSDREFLSDVYNPERNLKQQQEFTDSIASQLAPGKNKLVLKYLLSLFCEFLAAYHHDLPTVDYCKTHHIYDMHSYLKESFETRFKQSIATLRRTIGLSIDYMDSPSPYPYTVIITMINTAVNYLPDLP